MDISCDIIRDLLPLYAEDLVSEDSKQLVDEHLCICDPCMKQLAIMKKAAQLPVEVDTTALKRVGNTIRRRRILAVLTALLFVVTLGLGYALMMNARIYLTAEQAVDSVERLEDGRIFIRWTNSVIGMRTQQFNDSKTTGTVAWSNLTKLLFYPRERRSYEEERKLMEERDSVFQTQLTEEDYKYMGGLTLSGVDTHNVWYCNGWTGNAETLLWEGADSEPDTPLLEVNYHLACYCAALAVLAALLTVFGTFLRKKWYGELCIRLAIILGSLCMSAVIVSAGQFMGFYGDLQEQIINSTVLAVPMTLTALFGRQLYRLNKQDKGE